jgi:predicted GIY-YIG superfamily endonuclease
VGPPALFGADVIWQHQGDVGTKHRRARGDAMLRWLKRRFEGEERRLERELRVKVRRPDAVERLIAAEVERGASDRTEAMRRALARHEASQGR